MSHQWCLTEVVTEMSHQLSVERCVTMHLLMDETTLLHVMGSDGPHVVRSCITEFEVVWKVNISMDKVSYFVLISDTPEHVTTCLFHLMSLFLRVRGDTNPLNWTVGPGGKTTTPPFLLS